MAYFLSGFLLVAPFSAVKAFVLSPVTPLSSLPTQQLPHSSCQSTIRQPTFVCIYAPPGSGYFSEKDEISFLPDSYEPMMEYPGTMRPGRTPENIPFQDLPIADSDPDPVPWPHFQQIEWHHRWDPPHEHATPMEDFIEMHGRWATTELEATMRAGVRRGVRERREQEEAERRGTIITDDDEDDDEDEMQVNEDPVALGDGMFGKLGSDADRAQTAAAVDPTNRDGDGKESIFDDEEDDETEAADVGLDDFLFDLGLDTELGDEDVVADDKTVKDDDTEKSGAKSPPNVAKSLRDLESEDDDEEDVVDVGVKAIQVDDDDELDSVFDDEEDVTSSDDPVPLEDLGGSEDGQQLDTEDIFDEGGFDFGDDMDVDGGDVW
eukprot:CAMPEP_0198150334 /NCGR_PEP_ID=MMETSP1443-20131203/50410_1 /TAXON_ID=186043 /ORGANISM="Entomoneis sp., Strain CCMP2396" /LENGTH=377 /DNA_ID=CAMNT_0043815613 /DNA_START=164 /DNA_END=1294 /DNA_ORIENTATION=+